MNLNRKLYTIVLVVFAPFLGLSLNAQQSTPQEWKPFEGAMGYLGTMQPGDVFKFSMPRKDLRVSASGTQVKAGLALGSWVAFKKAGGRTMAMGDLVLTESEV